jgi:hypothetical protein
MNTDDTPGPSLIIGRATDAPLTITPATMTWGRGGALPHGTHPGAVQIDYSSGNCVARFAVRGDTESQPADISTELLARIRKRAEAVLQTEDGQRFAAVSSKLKAALQDIAAAEQTSAATADARDKVDILADNASDVLVKLTRDEVAAQRAKAGAVAIGERLDLERDRLFRKVTAAIETAANEATQELMDDMRRRHAEATARVVAAVGPALSEVVAIDKAFSALVNVNLVPRAIAGILGETSGRSLGPVGRPLNLKAASRQMGVETATAPATAG